MCIALGSFVVCCIHDHCAEEDRFHRSPIFQSTTRPGSVCGATSSIVIEYLEWYLARSQSSVAHSPAAPAKRSSTDDPQLYMERVLRTKLAGLYISRIEEEMRRGDQVHATASSPAEGIHQDYCKATTVQLEHLLHSSDVYDAEELLRRVVSSPGVLSDTSVISEIGCGDLPLQYECAEWGSTARRSSSHSQPNLAGPASAARAPQRCTGFSGAQQARPRPRWCILQNICC